MLPRTDPMSDRTYYFPCYNFISDHKRQVLDNSFSYNFRLESSSSILLLVLASQSISLNQLGLLPSEIN